MGLLVQDKLNLLLILTYQCQRLVIRGLNCANLLWFGGHKLISITDWFIKYTHRLLCVSKIHPDEEWLKH